MAAAMLAAYPAVFAAGAVVAGLPVGAAGDPAQALLRMRRADRSMTGPALAAAVHRQAGARPGRAWPRLSIWQGGQDRAVDPGNAELLALQWAALHGCPAEAARDTAPGVAARHKVWLAGGRAVVERRTLAGMGHGDPVAPGWGRPGPWVLEAGVPATQRIAAFWGLLPD